MKIAIVGGGISGLTAAWYLSGVSEIQTNTEKPSDIVLYEANRYAGGHTDTHVLNPGDQAIAVDSGFIVFNEHNYPCFTRMLRELGVGWEDSDMSFSAVNERTGMEYGADGLRRLLAQRRNIINPSFYRMLWDILRFYRETRSLLNGPEISQTLGDYLAENNYSKVFIENHIVPMACALWSASADIIEQFPLHYFLSFMNNHRMLQAGGRPQWKVITGGSSQYVKQITQKLGHRIRLGTPVTDIRRHPAGVTIKSDRYGSEHYDAVILAYHSDQALALLSDASTREKQVLGAILYQENQVTLHSDVAMMPVNRAAWASWNARIPEAESEKCHVSYWMNNLQNIRCTMPLIVSLNCREQIDPAKVWAERTYHHPVYTRETIVAQRSKAEINGINNTWFCGAYWGWGFHEDGVRSALDVVNQIEAENRHVAA